MNGRHRKLVSLAAVVAGLALTLVPAASPQGLYSDPTGDNASAGDITGVTVNADKTTGLITFTISGSNLISGTDHLAALAIDTDANSQTGSSGWMGADYFVAFGSDGYGFAHWNGSAWDWETPYATVHVHYSNGGVTLTVNRSELGNTSELNFMAEAADFTNDKYDDAPDNGTFNYSLDANGVDIVSVDVQTLPSSGPKASKKFVVTPTGIHLPPSGISLAVPPKPESYSCKGTLKGRAIAGTATGACTFRLPKKAKGKTLKVEVTVTYEGTSKVFPYVFKVR